MPELRGELRRNAPLAEYTSWRVGGPADRLYRPADADDLATFLAQLDAAEPLFWIGLGSNLLVRDGGIRGTVVVTNGVLNRIERREGDRVWAEAGVPSPKVARFCAREGLLGVEFLAGIPGTFGGALAMNAGCYGSETWQRVRRVDTIDRHGRRRQRTAGEFRVAYREVRGPAAEWFLAAELALQPGDTAQATMRMREFLDRRSAAQPIGVPNAGSVFRNPNGDYAARLIEAAGLKGRRRGAACVSEKHANFIVNMGGARAADIEALIAEVAETVRRVHGITLRPEVHVVGEAGHGGEAADA